MQLMASALAGGFQDVVRRRASCEVLSLELERRLYADNGAQVGCSMKHIARLQVEGDKWELYIPSKLGTAPRC